MPADVTKIGRPRASRSKPAGPVEEEILAAARALFREKGFAGTSTREIAGRVGLRQPSLFHYFKNKNEIFRAVSIGTVRPVLDFVAAEKSRRDPPDVAFYRLVRFDTYHLCTNENVLGSLFQFPEMTRDSQPEFWTLRDEIIEAYRKLLRRGARSGVFEIDDIPIATNFLFSFGESTLIWYRNSRRRPDAARVADTAGELALRAVLADPARLDEVVEAAAG